MYMNHKNEIFKSEKNVFYSDETTTKKHLFIIMLDIRKVDPFQQKDRNKKKPGDKYSNVLPHFIKMFPFYSIHFYVFFLFFPISIPYNIASKQHKQFSQA